MACLPCGAYVRTRTSLPHFLHPYNGASSSAGAPVCGSPQDWVTILESTGLGLVSFFLCGVACPAVALSLVRTSTARLVYVTPSGSGNWGVVLGGWAAWTAAVPLWRSAVRAPNLSALGEKGGQCLVAASPVRLHSVREDPVYALRWSRDRDACLGRAPSSSHPLWVGSGDGAAVQ
jgi:hypothetical protein